MRKMIKFRWFIFVAWLILCFLSLYFMPDLDVLVREKGQPSIPDHYSSQIANNLLGEIDGSSSGSDEIDVLAVFHNDRPLSSQQMKGIEAGIERLKGKEKDLGITGLLTHFDRKELEEQLLSKDGTAVLTPMRVELKKRKVSEIREQINKELANIPVNHYLTGAAFINEDFAQTSQDGVKKTELITVLFIIVVLILIFRSPVTPVISLLTVGISYLVSLGIMANLVDKLNFPFSNFTQIFLVLVLFGIGTDYNILLFSRFKEEMAQDKSIVESIVQTYKTAGKTVFYSAIAVFIGFSGLFWAQFSIFQSASAVAIGVFVLFLVLVTVVPICMFLLGKKLFWPFTGINEQKKTRSWTLAATFSVKRPLLSLLIVGIITVPILFLEGKPFSFNSLDEVDDRYPSIQGFHIVASAFSPGQAMPTSVVLKSEKNLDSPEAFAFIDQVTSTLEQVHGVKKVFGPTRPQGERIEALYVQDQTNKTEEGLGEAEGGIDTIQTGLLQAAGKLSSAPRQDFSKVGDLIEGTREAKDGIAQINVVLKRINHGIKEGASGAEKLHKGIASLKKGMRNLDQSSTTIAGSYEQLQQGYALFGEKYRGLEQHLSSLEQGMLVMQEQVRIIEEQHPELKEDPSFLKLKGTATHIASQVGEMKEGLKQLNGQYEKTTAQFAEANQGIRQVNRAQKQMLAGIQELEQGAQELAEGLKKGSKGQSQITASIASLHRGVEQINEGQKQLKGGLDTLDQGLSDLEEGLNNSGDGLDSIGNGLKEARLFLDELSGTEALDTFYVPENVRNGDDFQQALDAYMSADRQAMKWNVILDHDPYSTEAMQTIDQMNHRVTRQIQDFDDLSISFGIGGVPSNNQDLNQIATEDFNRTAFIMLAGIGLVLMFILRSFWNPVFIIGSLILAYFSSLAATELIYTRLLGYSGLTWTVPFFSFIMIVSLGVDYSIFLMMRYREYKDLTPSQGIILAAGSIGKVVVSAAVILMGTFASMYPSGVLTLTQIATVTVLGLALLTILFLPIFLPAVIAIHDRLNTPSRGI